MREALGAYRSTLHSLQMIVADSSGRLQTGGNIGVVDDIALFSAVRPYTCEAVRLQLEIDGERVSLRRVLARQVSHLLLNAKNILHMVAKLVRDNISLCKLCVAAA